MSGEQYVLNLGLQNPTPAKLTYATTGASPISIGRRTMARVKKVDPPKVRAKEVSRGLLAANRPAKSAKLRSHSRSVNCLLSAPGGTGV